LRKKTCQKTGKTEKCPICKDLTNIGEKLVKQSKIIIINPSDTDNNILKVPIFDKYGVCFEDDKNTYLQTNTADSLIKYWTFSINNITTTFKQFNAYVPKDQEGAVKTFEDIVANDDMKKGIKALGILKCDVDNLGKIFQIGISKRHGSSLSKIATFSRVMNSFFTIYLPNLLSTNPKYNNIYTVFAGGDDLFLIGRWDTIIELSYELKNAFNNFSCHNKQVTFSAGIAIAKPNEMIRSFYFYSEQALKQSKDNAGKDSLTIFNETIKWSQKDEMTGISDNLSKWQKSEILNSAALFKILSFIDMAQKSDNISKKIGNISVNLNDMQNFKWKALLNYFLTRNNAVKKQPSIVRDFVNQIDSNSRSSLKIAIWQNIYKNRIRG
jgi:CRISPR-associated protein Csm1